MGIHGEVILEVSVNIDLPRTVYTLSTFAIIVMLLTYEMFI